MTITASRFAIEIDVSLPVSPGYPNLATINRNEKCRGRNNPVLDNGPTILSATDPQWCDEQQIQLQFIQPGRPMQNGYVERNNGSPRKELMMLTCSSVSVEVREMAEEWQQDLQLSTTP